MSHRIAEHGIADVRFLPTSQVVDLIDGFYDVRSLLKLLDGGGKSLQNFFPA